MVTLRSRTRASAAQEDETAAAVTGGATAATAARAKPSTPARFRAATKRVLREAFWPTGTPVTADYAPFVRWNAIQALSSYVRGVLSSAAVYKSLGVGATAATPLAAATLTAVRDCAGTLGGIAFAWLQGSSFDAAAKQWRLFADVLNDLAMLLDLASPLLVSRIGPAGFLIVASAAALARALVGVAAGATGAALTHHFSRGGRGAAELSAKGDSRERAASIVGTLLGIGLARAVSSSLGGPWASWLLFAGLTWVHVWANVRAMRCLVLDTLTPARMELLLPLRWRESPLLPTPEQAAALECLLPPPFERAARRLWRSRPCPARVRFGAPLGEVLEAERRRRGRRSEAADPASVLAALRRRSALPGSYLVASKRRRRGWGGQEGAILVAVRKGADPDARLRAFAHAQVLAHETGGGAGEDEDEDEERAAEERAARWAAKEFSRWLGALRQAGWRADGAAALLPQGEACESEW